MEPGCCVLVGGWAEAQTALGKGRRGRLAQSSRLARAFPYPLILLDNVVTQAVLMWSAALLLGTIGVLILWFGFFSFPSPPPSSVNN